MKVEHYRILICDDKLSSEKRIELLHSVFGIEKETIEFESPPVPARRNSRTETDDEETTDIQSGKKEYFYRCEKKTKKSIVGTFGEKSTKDHRPTPDSKIVKVNNWINACFLLSLDRQEMLMELQPDFTKNNLKILRLFLGDFLAKRKKTLYEVEINSINKEEGGAWHVIEQNEVTSISITITPPNLFGHGNSMAKAAKEAKEKYNSKFLRVTLKSKEKALLKLDKEDEILKEGIEQVRKGGGRIVMKNQQNRKVYDSSARKNIKISEIDTDVRRLLKKNKIDEFLEDLLNNEPKE